MKSLIERYQRYPGDPLPIDHPKKTITVEFGLSLIQLLDLNAKSGILTTNCWVNQKWEDHFMVWHPDDHFGITNVKIPANLIWNPDIELINSADTGNSNPKPRKALVFSDGHVLYIQLNYFITSCTIDILNFPYDEQTCHFIFTSWAYDGTDLDLKLIQNGTLSFDLEHFTPNNEWEVISNTSVRELAYYKCCPNKPYPKLTFTLKLRRQPAYYAYTLILPCVLLSSLTLVMFCMPTDTTDKLGFGINIFLGFFLLLLVLSEQTPPSAASVPRIGMYFGLNMTMITLAMFLSVLILKLHKFSSKGVPKCVEVLFVKILAKVFCVSMTNDKRSRICKMKPGESKIEDVTNRRLWKIIVTVLDRFLCILYLIGIVVSLVMCFPKM